MTSIFREEALEAHSQRGFGSIRIAQLPSFSVVFVIACVCATGLVSLAVFGEVTRKARLTGLLVPMSGHLQITASSTGVIDELPIEEGHHVQQGQPLLVLNMDQTSGAGNTASLIAQQLVARRNGLGTERRARVQLVADRETVLGQRLQSLAEELRHIDRETALLTRREALAAKSLQRYGTLAQEGFVADVQRQQRDEELLDLQARLEASGRDRTALLREDQSLIAERRALRVQLVADLAQLDSSLSLLDQEIVQNEARRQTVVIAPREGTVTTLHVKKGQMVQAGQALATLVPGALDRPSDLEAQLFAPSKAVGFVKPGQRVWLRYASFPFQKFGMHPGSITAVSRAPLSAQELPHGQSLALSQAAQSAEPLYRVSVRLEAQHLSAYGAAQHLKPGMALDADVIQDHRAIWEWLLEPLLATRQKLERRSLVTDAAAALPAERGAH